MKLLYFPCHVQFELSTMCNGKCITCPNQEIQKIRGNMYPLLLEKIIMELSQNSEKVVTVTPLIHGEPLHYPGIIKILSDVFSAVGMNKVVLATNGQLLTEKTKEGKILFFQLACMIQKYYIKTLIFSVDGLFSYERVRTGLDQISTYHNIENFVSVLGEHDRSRVRVDMTVCKENVKDLPKFADYWNRREINWNFSPCDNRFSEEQAITSPSILPCRCLWESIFILSDGRVVPCCVDWQGENAMGDIYEDSIVTIWNSSAYNELRSLHLSGEKKKNALCARCRTYY